MEIIKLKIIEAITAHADETGIRVEEMLHWLHVATTEMYTYLFARCNYRDVHLSFRT